MPFDLTRALESTGGKALAPHRAFMDASVPVSTYSPGQPRTDAVISQREAMRHAGAYGGEQAIDWVYDAVNLYADPASTADWYLTKPDGTRLVRTKTKGTPPDYEVGPKDLYDLLDQPNPFMLYDELLALLVIDLLLVGNAYWLRWRPDGEGRPLALYRLAPGYVKIKPGPNGPKGYEYQPPGQRDKLTIKADGVIHFRRPNPHSAWYGMGVIQGGGRAMDLELAVTDTITSYYENKADPSLIIESDRRVPRDVMTKLRAQLRARSSGPNRAGEMLVLQNGLKASSLSPSASDALLKDIAAMSQYRVYGKFRAHPSLFGMPSTTQGTDKISDVRREFDNATLRPFLKKLSERVSAQLTAAWDCRFVINHRSVLPAEDAIKVGESVGKVPGIKVREVRRMYEQFGIEESTGDSELDETVLNEPLGNLGPDGQPLNPNVPSGADKPLSSEPGRPPKPSNTTAIKSRKSLDEVLAELEAKAVSTPLSGEKRPEDTFAVRRAADIDAIAASMQSQLADAARQLERSLLDEVEGKALKTSDLVGRVRGSKAWRTFRQRVEEILYEGMTRAASSGVLHSGLHPSEDVDYDAIANELLGRSDGLNSIVGTLKNRISGRLREARSAGAERHEFNAAIQAVISEWSTGQSATISATEAVHAYNESTLSAAELSGVKQVYVTDGDDHDEPCAAADGQVWDVAHARENRLEHPNCRRAFLPLTAVE